MQKKPASPAPMQPLGWVTSGLTTPSGAATELRRWVSSIICWSPISWMTTLRRASEASALVTGSYAVVLRTIPASMAACDTVSFAAVVLK